MKKRGLVVKNVLSALALQAVTIICGLIVPRMIIKSYGSEVNGLVVSIANFLSFISLIEFGFGPVVRSLLYRPIAKKNKREIINILYASEKFFRKLAYIFLAYIVMLCIILPVIAGGEFDASYTISLILIIAASTFFEYFFEITYRLFLAADRKMYVVYNLQNVALIINAILVVVLIKLGCNIQIVKITSSLVFVVKALLQCYFVKRKYNLQFDKADKKYQIQQKWDGLAQHVAYAIHENADIAILTISARMVDISIYYVYLIVVGGIKKILQSVAEGLAAIFGDTIARGDRQELRKDFYTYEILYFAVVTILFVSTLFLILPFIKVYTSNINDADYVMPIFGVLMVVAEFVWALRLPYSSIVHSAGHFKETRKGAFLEAILNIVISLILVWNFGLVGVAIGTLVAMVVRTVDFMWHASKSLLQRSFRYVLKHLMVIFIETSATLGVMYQIRNGDLLGITESLNGYLEWGVMAVKVLLVVSVIVVFVNVVLYWKTVFEFMKRLWCRR